MKKRNYGMISAAMMFAGMLGFAQVGQSSLAQHQQQQRTNEIKSTASIRAQSRAIVANRAGGLDLVSTGGYGLTPKEYGQRFGNGKSRKGKVNMLRVSHDTRRSHR